MHSAQNFDANNFVMTTFFGIGIKFLIFHEKGRRESCGALDHCILHRIPVRIQPWGRFFPAPARENVIFQVSRLVLGSSFINSFFLNSYPCLVGRDHIQSRRHGKDDRMVSPRIIPNHPVGLITKEDVPGNEAKLRKSLPSGRQQGAAFGGACKGAARFARRPFGFSCFPFGSGNPEKKT